MKYIVLNLILLICFRESYAQKNLLPIEKNSQWGLMNEDGKIVVNPQFDEPLDFDENGNSIIVKNGLFGIMNNLGEVIVKPKYNELMWLNTELLSFRKDSSWGVINLDQKVIVKPIYEEIILEDSYIHCYKKNLHAVYNPFGKLIVKDGYYLIRKSDSYWIIENEKGKLGVLNLTGKEILSIEYDSIRTFGDSLLFFKKDVWNCVFNQKIYSEVSFNRYRYLINNLWQISSLGSKNSILDISIGKIISDNEFSDFKVYDKKYIVGVMHHKSVMFDSLGHKMKISDYDDVKPIGFGLFVVKLHHKFGVVNNEGVIKMKLEYDGVMPFVYSVTQFQKDTLWGVLNKKGEVIVEPLYNKIEITDGHVRMYKSGVESAIRFNKDGQLEENFTNMNTIHIGNHKNKSHYTTRLKYIEPVYSTNCFALFHDGEALGSMIHKDVNKQAFILFNTCTNESIKSNFKILDANLEDFGNQDVVSCIIEGIQYAILHKNGHIVNSFEIEENGKKVKKHISYVGSFVNGYAMICVGGENQYYTNSDVLSGLTSYFDINNIKGGLWGFIDKKGNVSVGLEYQSVQNFSNGIALVKKELWGAVNDKNEVVLPFKYSELNRLTQSNDSLLIFAEDFHEKGLVDLNGDLVLSTDYENVVGVMEGVATIKNKGHYGFVDLKLGAKSDVKYEDARLFSDSLCAVKLNKKWGYINNRFNEVISFKFEQVTNFSHQLAFVKEQQHFEIINKNGDILTDLQLKEVFDYEHGVAIARKTDMYGLIDTKGEWIVHPKFHKIQRFNKHKTAIAHAAPGKHVLINTRGEHVTMHQFEQIEEFHEGLAIVKHHDLYGYVDSTGKLNIEAQFVDANSFSDGLARVKFDKQSNKVEKHHLYSFINIKGEVVLKDLPYEIIHPFNNGLALVEHKGEKFFINKTGVIALQSSKEIALESDFKEEKAIVRNKWTNRYFYIDKDGDKLFGKTFEFCEPFNRSIAIVKNDGKFGLLLENGTLLLDFKYDMISPFVGEYALVTLIRKYGIMNLSGTKILDADAEKIVPVNKNIYKIEIGNSIRYLLKSGRWLW